MVGAERSLTDTDAANADNVDNTDNTGNTGNTGNADNADNADNAANPWRINHLIQDNYSTLLPPTKAWSTPHHLINSQAISLHSPAPRGVSSVLCLKKPRRELKSLYPYTGATTIFQSSLEALLLLRQSPPSSKGLSCTKNRVGGKRSGFLPTFVFRPLTPPYVRFRIRRFFILRAV